MEISVFTTDNLWNRNWFITNKGLCISIEHESNTTRSIFQINNANLYVLVVTLSVNVNINFLENIKQKFKKRNCWNKYKSEIKRGTKSNNLDYLMYLTFRKINRFFVLSFKNDNIDSRRDSFKKYYMSLVVIKDLFY